MLRAAQRLKAAERCLEQAGCGPVELSNYASSRHSCSAACYSCRAGIACRDSRARSTCGSYVLGPAARALQSALDTTRAANSTAAASLPAAMCIAALRAPTARGAGRSRGGRGDSGDGRCTKLAASSTRGRDPGSHRRKRQRVAPPTEEPHVPPAQPKGPILHARPGRAARPCRGRRWPWLQNRSEASVVVVKAVSVPVAPTAPKTMASPAPARRRRRNSTTQHNSAHPSQIPPARRSTQQIMPPARPPCPRPASESSSRAADSHHIEGSAVRDVPAGAERVRRSCVDAVCASRPRARMGQSLRALPCRPQLLPDVIVAAGTPTAL